MTFSAPKAPKAPPPTPTPTRDEAKIRLQDEERQQRRKGRASTILTQGRSRTAQATQDAKTMLGM